MERIQVDYNSKKDLINELTKQSYDLIDLLEKKDADIEICKQKAKALHSGVLKLRNDEIRVTLSQTY